MMTFFHAILYLHIATAIFGFVLSGTLSVVALLARKSGTFSLTFWRWETVVQLNTVLLGVLGVLLWALGGRPKVIWHVLYGGVALLTVLVQRAVGTDAQMVDNLWPRRGPAPESGRDLRWVWIVFSLNAFLWAMYGRGLTTGFFGF
jgi:hypothetical protein